MNESPHVLDRNYSALGWLLEEISWVGRKIRNYRKGSRGYENVLTAEALQGLDFLPRRAFWGSILSTARGATSARKRLEKAIEHAEFTLLPGNQNLKPSGKARRFRFPVQPDGFIESASCFAVLEVKGILTASSFQPEQLSREYIS